MNLADENRSYLLLGAATGKSGLWEARGGLTSLFFRIAAFFALPGLLFYNSRNPEKWSNVNGPSR